MTRRLPQIGALRAFEAAARCSSFTKAAAELNVSTSAVSQQVRQLEDQLGVRLVDRRVTGLALTDDGRVFLPFVRRAFAALDDGLASLEDPDLPRTLTLSVLSSFSLKWLGPRLGEFAGANPHVAVSLFGNPEPPDFASSDYDLAIVWGRESDWPGYDSYFLMAERVFPVCTPGVAEQLPEDLHAAVSRSTLLTTPTHSEWPIWLEAAGHPSSEPAATRVFDNAALMIDAAIDGQGLAIARSALAHDALCDGALVRPFAPVLQSANAYHMVLPRERQIAPVVESFMDWLAGCARDCIVEQDELYPLCDTQPVAADG